MKMKKWIWIVIVVMIAAVCCIALNGKIVFFPDWVIRTAGVITMISMVVIVYNTVSNLKHIK